MRLEAAQGLIDRDPAAARAMLGQLHAATVDAIADIRRLVHGLRPPQLDELGLIGAIYERAAMLAPEGAGQPLRVTLDVPSELPALPAALEVAAYRIADEALTNVVRHAGARACTVRLSVGDTLAIEVRDDGRGITNGHRAGVGMSSMRERAAELGGSCDFLGAPGSGTIVRATLPLPAGPA
jgi:signal transduction histidine kinase